MSGCKDSRAHATTANLVMLTQVLSMVAQPAIAAGQWGGSVGAVSDYLVRGVSRSNHDAAVQGDAHVAFANGLVGGLFASSVQIAPDEQRNAELNVFLGWISNNDRAWRLKAIAGHYAYPWNPAGDRYDYDELTIDLGYRDWITLSTLYSPNSSRYLPEQGLINVTTTAIELNAQVPLRHHFAVSAGVGYAHLSGPQPGSYGYWSLACSYDWGPVSLSAGYVNTTSSAHDFYYDAAARDRGIAAILWRF